MTFPPLHPSPPHHLVLRRDGQHPPDEDPMGDDIQPGVGEAGRLLRPQDVQHVTERRQNLRDGDAG